MHETEKEIVQNIGKCIFFNNSLKLSREWVSKDWFMDREQQRSAAKHSVPLALAAAQRQRQKQRQWSFSLT